MTKDCQTIGIMEAWPPMNFVDGFGKQRGIGVDYIRAVNKRLGGVIKLVPGTFKDNLAAVPILESLLKKTD